MTDKKYVFNPKTLLFEEVKNNSYVKYVLGAIAVLLLLSMSSVVKITKVFEKVPVVIHYSEEPCDSANLCKYIQTLNLRFPKIVYQQVMLESNYLSSSLYKTQNNLLGMENATYRPTIGKNLGTRFAYYNNWKESLIDYALWQSYLTKDIKTEEEYYTFLDKVYCPEQLEENKGEKYSTRLKRIQ